MINKFAAATCHFHPINLAKSCNFSKLGSCHYCRQCGGAKVHQPFLGHSVSYIVPRRLLQSGDLLPAGGGRWRVRLPDLPPGRHARRQAQPGCPRRSQVLHLHPLHLHLHLLLYLHLFYTCTRSVRPVESSVTVKEGEEVTLECVVGGNPTPSIAWTKQVTHGT